MSNLENELRQAMIEETTALGAPPDLAQQAMRRARQRRRSHLMAVAMVTAIVAGAAVPVYLGVQTNSVASPSLSALIDGVQVGYLPSGLGVPTQEKIQDGGLPGTTAIWGSGDDQVRVTVYRSAFLEGENRERMLDRLKESVDALRAGVPMSVRGRAGLLGPEDDDLAWVERPNLVLRVTVGTQHRSDLQAIANGLVPDEPTGGVFEDLLLTYLPTGLYPNGFTSEFDSAFWTQTRWSGGGASVRLLAVRGVGAADPQKLLAWARAHQHLSTGTPQKVRGRSGYRAVLAVPSQTETPARLWLEKPGLGYILSVSQTLEPELDRIVDGVVPTEPPPAPGERVDHVGVAHLPSGLRRAADGIRLGTDWSATTGRWSDGRREVEVTVVRGGVLHTSQWVNEFLRGEKRQPSRVAKQPVGIRTTDPDGRRGAFWETPKVAVHVKVSPDLAGELDKIVGGIHVPSF